MLLPDFDLYVASLKMSCIDEVDHMTAERNSIAVRLRFLYTICGRSKNVWYYIFCFTSFLFGILVKIVIEIDIIFMYCFNFLFCI